MGKKLTYKVIHREDGTVLLTADSPSTAVDWLRDYVLAHPEEVAELSFKLYVGKSKTPAFSYDGLDILGYIDDNEDMIGPEEDEEF